MMIGFRERERGGGHDDRFQRERERGYKNHNEGTNRNVTEGNSEIQAIIPADRAPKLKIDCFSNNQPMGRDWLKQTQTGGR